MSTSRKYDRVRYGRVLEREVGNAKRIARMRGVYDLCRELYNTIGALFVQVGVIFRDLQPSRSVAP